MGTYDFGRTAGVDAVYSQDCATKPTHSCSYCLLYVAR